MSKIINTIIPIHIAKWNHWVLICVNVLEKSILYYDSCEKSKRENKLRISLKIFEYLKLEFCDKKMTDNWKMIDGNSPWKNNHYDGGIFVCANAELFSRNEESDFFTHTHINLYRQRIVAEILHNNLIV